MLKVTRVYWWTDWLANVRRALRDLWCAAFGCQHQVTTIRFGNIGVLNGLHTGEWASYHVNECSKCGKTFEVLHWSGKKTLAPGVRGQ